MQMKEIFDKDVQRPIEGVIKADDVVHLGTEVDEYVLTNEVAKGLEQLLEFYTNYINVNGIWISGFFGSGKSHLLKMLAHLLGDVEGQAFDRSSVSQNFLAKANGAFLPALLSKAERIPAKSLLFNIDQKATLISKDQTDALLKVFVKVFDESRGYYGNQGHVGRFERDLDSRGQYEAFKGAFERIAGIPWSQGREQTVLEADAIDAAFNEVDGGSNTGIIKQYNASYSVSIEDFADEVKAWLDSQPEGFRLNFFVDEVGQFIGSDIKLMLNLQTITESLATKCGGRSWVFVTSQEDMDKVVGDRTKQQGNDFSKIQARFRPVKLNSADVEEVIRKRLLEKNDAGRAALKAVYAEESANFKTLFDFTDGARSYRNYPNEDLFVGTYPFVSYQFTLFQEAIEGVSEHNVFEGRNSSVGERSMLGVVQQVAKDIATYEVGCVASFDRMFAGIRASVKAAAQRSIITAEQNLDNPLAVRLLKALFLVKYVDGFQATARNLTVLVYDRFGLDLPALSDEVKKALAELEAQTYIQRNGNVYAYLTNEEQAIEEEIKNVEIDSSEVGARLNKILSADVIKTNKLRYAKTGQDFAFGFKLDDQPYGKQHELSIHFITPEYPYTPDEVRMHSAGKDELRVVLDPDARVLSDLRLLLKTAKYTKQKQTSSLSAIEDQILRSKALQNDGREKDLIERIRRAVGEAGLIINATDVASTSADALARVTDGFQDLLNRTYTQLKLLGGVVYTEQQVAAAADPESGLFDASTLSKLAVPADDLLSAVVRKTGLGEQVTVRTLVDTFQTKPYGWDLASIEVIIAHLAGSSKVTLTMDGNQLKRSEVAGALRNTQKHTHIVVAPQKDYDERKVAAFRKFCTDFFDDGSTPKDAAELAQYGADKLNSKLDELRALAAGAKYPFVTQLEAPIALLEQSVGKGPDCYLTTFDLGDALLDAKENTLDPILAFLGGTQHTIYDDAVELLSTHAGNLDYLPAGSDSAVRAVLNSPNAFRGNRMAQLKADTAVLREQIDQAITAARAAGTASVGERKTGLLASAAYEKATPDTQQSVIAAVDQTLSRIQVANQIAVLRQISTDFEDNVYPALLDQLASSEQNSGQPLKQTVSINKISVSGVSGVLETDSDVDTYLAALRTALIQALNDGKRISL